MRIRSKYLVFSAAIFALPGVALSQLSPATVPAPTVGFPFVGKWCPANERGEDISEGPDEIITINGVSIQTDKDRFEIADIDRQTDETYALKGVWSPEGQTARVRIHMRGETFMAMSGLPQTLALFIRCDT